MERPGLSELFSFDHLATPRIAAAVFWIAQVANASVWVLILRSVYKQVDYGDIASWETSITGEGEMAPDYGMPPETIQWDNIWVCLVLFVLGVVVIRVLVDVALVQFRRLDAERGILDALGGRSSATGGTVPPPPG